MHRCLRFKAAIIRGELRKMDKGKQEKTGKKYQIIRLIHKVDGKILPLFLISAVIETFLPYINIGMPALILDALSKKQGKETIIFYIIITVLLNAFILLVTSILNYFKGMRSYHFSNKYSWMKTEKIFTMDYPYLEDSDFINLRQNIRYNDENTGAFTGMPGRIAGIFQACLSIGIAFVSFVTLFVQIIFSIREKEGQATPWMFVLLILFICLSIWIVRKLQKKAEKSIPEMTEKVVSDNRASMYLAEEVVHNYSLGKDVRVYEIDKLVIDEMEKMDQSYTEYCRKSNKVTTLPGAISSASSAIISGIVFSVVGIYALSGMIGVGSVVFTVGVVEQFISSISNLIFRMGDFSISCARLDAVLKLFHLPKLKRDENNAVKKAGQYEIEFRNVSFQYPKTDRWALRNVSLKIKSGEHIAVVGTNGSGKTTLIKLLCRLYDPTEGEILLNGVDIRTFSEKEYLELLSIVFQDFKLFAFTLGENVAAAESYEKEKAREALIKVGFEDRLKRLEKGLETSLYRDFEEEGVEVSGGEAQKIAIARALYRNASMIILDEPTAALDPIAEQEIYEKFHTLVEGKTAVYISHRLSSCRFCDTILVIHEGKLVQKGSHDDLVRQTEGKYYELWNAQAQYYMK